MAYTKIWEIAERLDTSIAYIVNEKKTENGDARYVTCWNCNQNNPYHSMMMTKNLFHKTDTKRIGFHATQSFAPGEGTPEMIHEIGLKWAKELFGDRYEFVLTTHVDKDHLHNHLIINSTSFVDGKQFTNSKKDRHRMMEVNDRLCKEYGLSVIENPQEGRKENYNKHRNYIKEIKKDFDFAIEHAATLDLAYRNMMMEGYDFVTIDDVDCIVHPNCIEPIPMRQLGKRYSKEGIIETILGMDSYNRISYKSFDDLYKRKNELTGFQKLYFRFLYLVGVLPKYQVHKNKISSEARKELKELDQISFETELFAKYKINTIEDLNSVREEFQNEMTQLVKQRKNYYQLGSKHADPIEKEHLYLQAKRYTPRIKELRKMIKALDHAEKRSKRLEALNLQIEKKKEKEK